jgi:hypothetical protein
MEQPRKRSGRRAAEPLVDWHAPERNAHVLDWHERAHDFGLVPIDDHEQIDHVIEPADRLMEEEEPEAYDDQPLDTAEEEALTPDEMDEEPDARLPGEELDLVRVYLNHIGRRRLLTAAEEQAIGRTIEVARTDLLAALIVIPSARSTLLSLADSVRQNEVPAAELILLPDGASRWWQSSAISRSARRSSTRSCPSSPNSTARARCLASCISSSSGFASASMRSTKPSVS